MDFSKLTLGSKIVAGAGILLLVDSFLHWQEVNFGPISAGVTMWHGWGVLIGLTLLAILAWEAAQLTETKIAVGPLSPTMVTMLLAALLVLFTLIKVLVERLCRDLGVGRARPLDRGRRRCLDEHAGGRRVARRPEVVLHAGRFQHACACDGGCTGRSGRPAFGARDAGSAGGDQRGSGRHDDLTARRPRVKCR